MAVRTFHRDAPDLRMPMISRDARLIVWPGVGAWDATMNYVVLEPGEENVPHHHPVSEDTIYILEGRGTVRDLSHDCAFGFEAGQAIFVPVGVRHQVCADRGEHVVSVGGPCPADVEMLERSGVRVPARR